MRVTIIHNRNPAWLGDGATTADLERYEAILRGLVERRLGVDEIAFEDGPDGEKFEGCSLDDEADAREMVECLRGSDEWEEGELADHGLGTATDVAAPIRERSADDPSK